MTGNENLEESKTGSSENPGLEVLQDSGGPAAAAAAENDSSLKALIDQEQTLPHAQLRAELGREPTPEEVDEWLSAHTESY